MKKIISVLAIALIFALCLPVAVMAADSPVAPSTYKCEVSPNNANAGSVNKVDKGNNVYEITATPANGYKFVDWTITGEYEIKQGTAKDKLVIVGISSDVKAVANFNAISSEGDKDPTAPPTGDSVYMLVFACLAALAGAGYAFKKARA